MHGCVRYGLVQILEAFNTNTWVVAAYLLAAALACLTGLRERSAKQAQQNATLLPAFWFLTSALFLSIAIAHAGELGGSLTGNAATGRENDQFANGMLSVYLSPEVFDQGGGFADDVKRYINYVKDARRVDPDKPVLTPGEPERATRVERLENGIPLPQETWASIAATALKVGIDEARVASISGHNAA